MPGPAILILRSTNRNYPVDLGPELERAGHEVASLESLEEYFSCPLRQLPFLAIFEIGSQLDMDRALIAYDWSEKMQPVARARYLLLLASKNLQLGERLRRFGGAEVATLPQPTRNLLFKLDLQIKLLQSEKSSGRPEMEGFLTQVEESGAQHRRVLVLRGQGAGAGTWQEGKESATGQIRWRWVRRSLVGEPEKTTVISGGFAWEVESLAAPAFDEKKNGWLVEDEEAEVRCLHGEKEIFSESVKKADAKRASPRSAIEPEDGAAAEARVEQPEQADRAHSEPKEEEAKPLSSPEPQEPWEFPKLASRGENPVEAREQKPATPRDQTETPQKAAEKQGRVRPEVESIEQEKTVRTRDRAVPPAAGEKPAAPQWNLHAGDGSTVKAASGEWNVLEAKARARKAEGEEKTRERTAATKPRKEEHPKKAEPGEERIPSVRSEEETTGNRSEPISSWETAPAPAAELGRQKQEPERAAEEKNLAPAISAPEKTEVVKALAPAARESTATDAAAHAGSSQRIFSEPRPGPEKSLSALELSLAAPAADPMAPWQAPEGENNRVRAAAKKISGEPAEEAPWTNKQEASAKPSEWVKSSPATAPEQEPEQRILAKKTSDYEAETRVRKEAAAPESSEKIVVREKPPLGAAGKIVVRADESRKENLGRPEESAGEHYLRSRHFVLLGLSELGDQESSWHPVGRYRIYLSAQHRYFGLKDPRDVLPLWIYEGELAPEFLDAKDAWKFYDRPPVPLYALESLPLDITDFLYALAGQSPPGESQEKRLAGAGGFPAPAAASGADHRAQGANSQYSAPAAKRSPWGALAEILRKIFGGS